ncbi:unnamed protein product [Rangifer tarandus platyrhynchus]|uniref:Uncharacterized protein n=2 Tax=Rangifer tarandus platyrhynchus TaxID=3082113 RepID=A0AC59Z9S2_RANTA|nr:unnamed protein product [Rangifer tarandus platyrhynchus]
MSGPDARLPLPVLQPDQASGPREMSGPHQSPLTQGSSSSILPPPKSRACDPGTMGAGPQMSSAEAMARSGVSRPVGSDVCSGRETRDSEATGLPPGALRSCQAVPASP